MENREHIQLQRKQVKTILWRFLLFCSPLLLGLGWLEMEQHRLPNGYTQKKSLLEAGLSQWSTLILGSSHSYMGINPALLDGRAYNLAFTAQTLYFDQYLLENYIDQMPALERVILPISYLSFASESYVNPGTYDRSYHYHHFYGSKAFIDLLAPRRYSLVSLFTVKRSVDRTLDYYQEGDSLYSFDRLGWSTESRDPRDKNDLDRKGKDTGEFHDRFYFDKFYPVNTQRVAQMIEACKARNIQIYLISTPIWSSYLAHTRKDRQDQMVHTADSLAISHQVPYWNFIEDGRFVAEDFYDPNHLFQKGAEKFSRILNAQIQTYESSNQPPAQAQTTHHAHTMDF